MEVFHCAGASEADIPLYNGPCDAADRPQATQVSIIFNIIKKNTKINLFITCRFVKKY